MSRETPNRSAIAPIRMAAITSFMRPYDALGLGRGGRRKPRISPTRFFPPRVDAGDKGANVAPSSDWFRAQIEAHARPKAAVAERQELYRDVAAFGPDDEEVLLAEICWVQQVHRGQKEAARQADWEDWYTDRVHALRRALTEIAEDDLVAGGLDVESVVFFSPQEVNCKHGRRTKKCAMIRQKLELRLRLQILVTSPALPLGTPLRRRIDNNIETLGEEVRELDHHVEPANAQPMDFCTLPIHRESDAGSANEQTGEEKRGGRPEDHLQQRLLETIGQHLRSLGQTHRQIAQLVARLLVHVFGRKGGEQDVAESVARYWRDLRKRGGS